MKKNEKIHALRMALLKAIEAAKKFSTIDDRGTSNFDTPVIKLSGWRESEIREAFLLTGVFPDVEKDGTVQILRACLGQGFRRTAMAEAFRDSLRESGYTAYVNYQID